MKRLASEVLRELEIRVARLEREAIFGLFKSSPLDKVHDWFLEGMKKNRAVKSNLKKDRAGRLTGSFVYEGETYKVTHKNTFEDAVSNYEITGGNADFRSVSFKINGDHADTWKREDVYGRKVLSGVLHRVSMESAWKKLQENQRMMEEERARHWNR